MPIHHVYFEKSTYGLVDRVPGLFHVETEFWAINGALPVAIADTWLVLEADSPSPGMMLELPRSAKSWLMALIRAVLGVIAVFASALLVITLAAGVPHGVPVTIGQLLASLAGIDVICLLLYGFSRWLSRPNRERATELGSLAGIPEHEIIARL